MVDKELTDYTIEVTTNFTEDFVDYISSICDKRSKEVKELRENYTAETMKRSFREKRFTHGFFIIKYKGNVLQTFGIDDYKGWGVMSRFLTHQPGKWHHTGGIFWPFLKKHLNGKVVGLCSVHNTGHRNIAVVTQTKLLRHVARNTNTSTMLQLAADLHANSRLLDFKVFYRNTVQEVYTYYTDKIPPFERYSGSL